MSTPQLIESYAGTHPGLTDREIVAALGLGHQQVEHILGRLWTAGGGLWRGRAVGTDTRSAGHGEGRARRPAPGEMRNSFAFGYAAGGCPLSPLAAA